MRLKLDQALTLYCHKINQPFHLANILLKLDVNAFNEADSDSGSCILVDLIKCSNVVALVALEIREFGH